MADPRPAIPRELERAVLVEAGHRCAIPTCRQTPVEIHHIVPWAQVGEHQFDNLVALCPNDHARATRGEIDRRSIRAYKHNLAVLTSRYGDMEHRLLDLFAGSPETREIMVERAMDFEFMYLLRDGLLMRGRQLTGIRVDTPAGAFMEGPTAYGLTDKGVEFIQHLTDGAPLEGH